MATQTYRGSCHCGAIRFEVDLDLARGTGKCNCSYCWKVRNWSIQAAPEAFRIQAGQDAVGEYRFREDSVNYHAFCKRCGVRLYTAGYVEAIGGRFVSVMLSVLDDLPPAALAAAPVQYMNGRDDDWFHPPAETAHL